MAQKFKFYAAKYGSATIITRKWAEILYFQTQHPECRFKGFHDTKSAQDWLDSKTQGKSSLELSADALLRRHGCGHLTRTK